MLTSVGHRENVEFSSGGAEEALIVYADGDLPISGPCIHGGEGFQFEKELSDGEMRRDNATYAVLVHQNEHGG